MMKFPSHVSILLVCLTSYLLFFSFTQGASPYGRSSHRRGIERVNNNKAKSKIFIVGSIGRFGRYVTEASIKAKHTTIGLVRAIPSANETEKINLIAQFKSWGVKIVYGDFNIDRKLIVKTMKKVDVVISCVGGSETPTQVNLTSAIVEAGNIKRFLPSEFAIDVDRLQDPVEPAKGMFANKANIRRVVESLGIPHTYVVANGFSARFWPNLAQVNPPVLLPYIEEVVAYGTGDSKATASYEADIATYTIKTIDDPLTLNKNLYISPPLNALSYNELFSLWETKSGNTLSKSYVSEEEMLQMINDPTNTINGLLAICYSVAIKNDYGSYVIDPSFGYEASALYPEVIYKSVGNYFDEVLANATLISSSNGAEGTFSI
ncbi:hypothetical protein Leryth_002762 [Lithospermum erythrorhizon]|nr:hypothetical protein Leryth_002762 [Lithospermum erythrorhizon]